MEAGPSEDADPADSFTYDPRNPVPTLGGAVCCDPKIFPWGPMDQRPVEKRKDVLVYTSAPLKQDLEVTGPIRVVLYASTSALGYRLHGQAGGCVSERRSAQSDGRHPARALSGWFGKGRAGRAGRRFIR